MKTVNLCFVLVALLGLVPLDLAEVLTSWQHCPVKPETPIKCVVHEVRVEPCREAARRKPCAVRRGNTGSISFDFTPLFTGGNLETRAYRVAAGVDTPLVGINTNACQSTNCPVDPGTQQTYNYTLSFGRNFPSKALYDVKWKLRNPENHECCFQFKIRLTR